MVELPIQSNKQCNKKEQGWGGGGGGETKSEKRGIGNMWFFY